MARQEPAPPPGTKSDYRALGGKSRRYANRDTGQTISRRQYENLAYRDYGWHSWSEYQRASRTYRRQAARPHSSEGTWGAIARQDLGYKTEGPKSVGGSRSEFLALWWRAYGDSQGKRKHYGSLRPDGPFAKLLEYLGLREHGAPYNVGDTPKKAAKR